jgi:hypothetical protein
VKGAGLTFVAKIHRHSSAAQARIRFNTRAAASQQPSGSSEDELWRTLAELKAVGEKTERAVEKTNRGVADITEYLVSAGPDAPRPRLVLKDAHGAVKHVLRTSGAVPSGCEQAALDALGESLLLEV